MSVLFPHLQADIYSRRHPQLRDTLFALAIPDQNRMRICSVSPGAQQEGIRPGMVVADARTLIPALQVFTDEVPDIAQSLQQLAIWALRFTPVAAADAPDGLILDISGCPHLWQGERPYADCIKQRLNQAGFTAYTGISDTPGAAWAIVRFLPQCDILEPGTHHHILPSLPVAALRLDDQLAERFSKLGMYRIRDILHLPRQSLRRRFGSVPADRLDRVFGIQTELITPAVPPPEYIGRLPCPEPVHTAVAVTAALETLLTQLCNHLSRAGKGLRHCILQVHRTDSETRKLELRTARATRQVQHLLHLFSLRIDQIDPGLGIELFTLEAALTEPLLPEQEILWAQQEQQHIRQTALLLDKIRAYLPQAAVYRQLPKEHHWPDRSVENVPDVVQQPSTQWREDLPRPVHVFNPAREISVMVPIPDYPPVQFNYESRIHRIIKADGPERIEAEWWTGIIPHRDYYCVEDEQGQRYWLYREGHYNDEHTKWFLHGLFA
ncbi:MAG: DNA polymerase Y family protein [Chitinophagaceae bacterium]